MFKIAFLGDFCVKDTSSLTIGEELKKILEDCDYKVCNFEAPIATPNRTAISKSGPAIEQPLESAEFLKKNGLNIFLLANNHIMDYGIDGLNTTIKSFQQYRTVGAGMDPYSVTTCCLGDKIIGFLALSQYEFGMVKSYEKEKSGVAWICDEYIEDIIKKSKSECDFLFICPHAGVEDIYAPLPEWREHYKYLIDCGADAIIATHPHTPQGWELYKNKYIFYSLGNFCFDLGEQPIEPYFNNGICVEFEFKEDTVICNPYAIVYQNGKIEIDNKTGIKSHIEYLNSLLNNRNEYNLYLDDECERLFPLYKYGMLRGLSGHTFSLGIAKCIKMLVANIVKKEEYPFLLNVFQCESHRWLIERYIRNKMR